MKRLNSGFTLIELMVTIAVLAVLIAVAVPSFTSTIKSNNSIAERDRFLAALGLARIESVKRNMPVNLCKSSNGSSCGGSSVNWHDGWIIWSDTDDDSSLDASEVIQVEGAARGRFTLIQSTSEADGRSVIYRADGSAVTNGNQSSFSFWLCPDDSDQNYARTISLSSTGRPSSSKGATCP